MNTISRRRAKRSLLCVGMTLVVGLALMPVGALSQSANVATGFDKDVDAQIARHYASVEGLYKDIHANPELAFEETKTAKKLAKELRDLGFDGMGGGSGENQGLVSFTMCENLELAGLSVANGSGTGVSLQASSGRMARPMRAALTSATCAASRTSSS